MSHRAHCPAGPWGQALRSARRGYKEAGYWMFSQDSKNTDTNVDTA